MEYTVVNIFGAYIEYFALYAFLWIFFDTNPTRKHWRFGCHIIMPVLFLLFASYISSVYLRPLLFIICSWFIALGFTGFIGHRFFSVSIFQISLVLLEFLISFLVSPIADFNNPSVYLACVILVKIATLIVLAILFFFSQKYQLFFFNISHKYTIILLSFSATSFFLIMLIVYLLSLVNNTSFFIVECFAIFLCIVTNIGLYYLFYQISIGEDAKNRLRLIDFHLSSQKEEQTYMEQAYREIRKISHDMNRYLSIIYSLLQQNEVKLAMAELEKRQIEISNNQLFDTGYPIINSVLSYKLQLTQNQNIRTQLFWNITDTLKINLTDLAVILSNALDNAIEAACQVQQSIPFITVSAELNDDYIILKICNNTLSCPIIVNGKIQTSKKDKLQHGLGLESIRKLARQYDGDSFPECQNNIFTLTVVIKNTESIA